MTKDVIYRQAAIDALMEILDRPNHAEFLYTDEICKALNNLPSAQSALQWIPFKNRELTPEEQEEYPEWSCIMDCPLPDDGQEILVSDGKWVWKDEFCVDDGCYLDSNHELEGCAWMPLPIPWRGADDD